MVSEEEECVLTITLRLLLVFVAVFNFFLITYKIRESNVRIMDMFFWVACSILFIIMGIFPQIVSMFSHMIGFESPTNFVFLLVIFLLLFKCFLMSIEISRQREQINEVLEETAIRLEELSEEVKKIEDSVSESAI